MEQSITLLCDIDPMLDDVKILARCLSIWKSHPAGKPHEVWSLDMVLQDEQIVTLQGNLLMGGRLDHDQYRDWRLDVDNMSYEELLDLGDKIGYVCTGLREDEIHRCVRKAKPPVVSEDKSSSSIPTEMQWKCTVCQEYEEEEEIGKLDCGHFYHMYCIKQWLAQKKTCPICKTEAAVKSQQQAG